LKISLQATVVIGTIFCVASLAVAVTAFASLGDIHDPAQAADAKGYAFFWAFLACVSACTATAAWWLARSARRRDGA